VVKQMGSTATLTTAADIFAIGMIGVVLLTGQSALAQQLPAMRDEIERLLVTSGVPAATAKALQLCVSRCAEQRPTAEQLSAFLSRGMAWWHPESALAAPAPQPIADGASVRRWLSLCAIF
jgi:hypothetical protein